MTLESRINKHRYIGNGSTKTFAFSFKAWKDAQIKVFVGDGNTETDMTQHVTVSRTPSGGSVTFPFAPDAGKIIVIRRDMPYIQEDDYINGTRYNGEEVEDRFDQDCAERQDLLLGLERAVKVPETSNVSGDQLVADLMQARQDVIWALNQAGDVTGATRVTAAGSSEPRALQDRFADFINVKDYGAKGDGVTDDTAAINAAISNAALGCLLFPKGVYCISDTLTMTGNANGAYWFFGESHLKWIGEEAGEDYASHESELPSTLTDNQRNAAIYNIENYGWAYYAKPMIYIAPASSGTWSRCIIDGGNFNGDNKASTAIKVHSFGALIRGVRAGRVKHCGIALCGNLPWSASSGGVMLSDCYVANANASGLGNSGSRQQHNLSNDIGIYVHDLDNKINNCISNFFGDEIVLRSSGNQINNCHTTVQFPRDSEGYVVDDNGTRVSEYPECANIVVDPDLGTSISGSNFLSNCYFNSGKYLVKGITGSLMNTDISGGAYFLKSAMVKIYGKDTTEAYLYGGTMAQPFHANGLTCHHPSYFQVYDYYPNHAISSTFMDTSIDINHNSNPSGVQILDAGNLISQKSDDPMQICSAAYPIAQGRYALIGAILYYFPNSTVMHSGNLEYSFWHLNQSCIKGHLFFNGNTQKWQTKNAENVYGAFGDVEFFVDNQIHSATINGKTYKYSKLYCGSSSIDVDGITFGYIRSRDKFCRVYMFSMHNYSRMEYITSLPADYTSLLPSE